MNAPVGCTPPVECTPAATVRTLVRCFQSLCRRLGKNAAAAATVETNGSGTITPQSLIFCLWHALLGLAPVRSTGLLAKAKVRLSLLQTDLRT